MPGPSFQSKVPIEGCDGASNRLSYCCEMPLSPICSVSGTLLMDEHVKAMACDRAFDPCSASVTAPDVRSHPFVANAFAIILPGHGGSPSVCGNGRSPDGRRFGQESDGLSNADRKSDPGTDDFAQ